MYFGPVIFFFFNFNSYPKETVVFKLYVKAV